MNTKMKMLSLALIGAFGYAGVAAADCPSSPVPPWAAADAIGGTLVIATPGYAGTECRLDSSLTGGLASFATVRDDSPNGEPRYRAQFIVNADALSSMGFTDAVYLFTANSTTGPQVSLSIVGDGAGGRLLSFNVPNTTAPLGSTVGSLSLAGGENVIEFDLDNSSHFKIWVNSSNESSPSYATTAFDNGGATIDTAFLGLAGPTPGYLSRFSGVKVGFDQFDSRRQSFIGF